MTGSTDHPDLIAEARRTARRLLGVGSDRWRHTAAVARRAGELAALLRVDPEPLVAAAWLHDIGYAKALAVTGFHPLDGARYLAEQGWPTRIAGLVAQHSGAWYVAAARGLADALSAYAGETGLTSDLLTYADQTVGPVGQPLTVRERNVEMLRRHGPDSANARVNVERLAFLEAVAVRVEACLDAAASRHVHGSGHLTLSG